jgi:hypothetical protein
MTVLAVNRGELERNGRQASPSLLFAKPSDHHGSR